MSKTLNFLLIISVLVFAKLVFISLVTIVNIKLNTAVIWSRNSVKRIVTRKENHKFITAKFSTGLLVGLTYLLPFVSHKVRLKLFEKLLSLHLRAWTGGEKGWKSASFSVKTKETEALFLQVSLHEYQYVMKHKLFVIRNNDEFDQTDIFVFNEMKRISKKERKVETVIW